MNYSPWKFNYVNATECEHVCLCVSVCSSTVIVKCYLSLPRALCRSQKPLNMFEWMEFWLKFIQNGMIECGVDTKGMHFVDLNEKRCNEFALTKWWSEISQLKRFNFSSNSSSLSSSAIHFRIFWIEIQCQRGTNGNRFCRLKAFKYFVHFNSSLSQTFVCAFVAHTSSDSSHENRNCSNAKEEKFSTPSIANSSAH